MRLLGFLVALVLILLASASLISDSGILSTIVRGRSEPAGIVTIAQTATVAGWQIALSLNSIHTNSASACEYSTLRPGTRRMAADVTITPVASPCLFAGFQIFSLVDNGEYRYSLRLPDYDPDGSTPPGPSLAGQSEHRSTLSDVTDTPGMKYSLEPIANGLWGRIACDRTDSVQPAPT